MKKMQKALNKIAKVARKAVKAALPGANNKPGAFVRVAMLPRDSRLARARMRGWNDVATGKGFRESYDRWKKAAQLAYERGRQEAVRAKVVALGRGTAIDTWSRDEYVTGPMSRACGYVIGQQIIDEMRASVRSVK